MITDVNMPCREARFCDLSLVVGDERTQLSGEMLQMFFNCKKSREKPDEEKQRPCKTEPFFSKSSERFCVKTLLQKASFGIMCEWEQGSIFRGICVANLPPRDLVIFQGECPYDCVVNERSNTASKHAKARVC